MDGDHTLSYHDEDWKESLFTQNTEARYPKWTVRDGSEWQREQEDTQSVANSAASFTTSACRPQHVSHGRQLIAGHTVLDAQVTHGHRMCTNLLDGR